MYTGQLTRLKASVARLDVLPRLLERLEKAGHLVALGHVFTQVFTTEQGKLSPRDVKDCLRLLTDMLIEDAYRTAELVNTTAASETSKAGPVEWNVGVEELQREMRVQEGRREGWVQSAQNSPTHSRAKSVAQKTVSQQSTPSKGSQQLKGLSDFSDPVSTALFSKAQRRTLEVHDVSPGPAHYRQDTKPKSPGGVIARGGTRFLFRIPDTPGPGGYTPLRGFVAKR